MFDLPGPPLTSIDFCLEEKRSLEDLAIEVRGGYKSFGKDSRRVNVMKNFNMSVPRGNIYGLLGRMVGIEGG